MLSAEPNKEGKGGSQSDNKGGDGNKDNFDPIDMAGSDERIEDSRYKREAEGPRINISRIVDRCLN